MEETGLIWMNGEFVPWQEAKIHVLTHTLHYGAGVFEGIRFYETGEGPAVFRLKDHIDRLYYSAGTLGMKIPYSKGEFVEATKETVRKSGLNSGYIRPICFFGYGKMGLNPEGAAVNCAIAVWPWGRYLGEDAARVKTSKYRRIPPESTHPDAKICGHYVNSILASLEAKKAGYDEALLLDYKGNVAEGPGENIFIVRGERLLFTPPLGTILRGITRDSVIELAKDHDIGVEETPFALEGVYNADEAFFTGTAVEIAAIRSVDDRMIGDEVPGPVTKKLKAVFTGIVHGRNERYKDWLTHVNE